MLPTLPVLVIGVLLNVLYPAVFSVAGPPYWLRVVSIVGLVVGVAVWAWSVVLILTKVPKHELITTGPFALMKHPLYTSVALLVVPCIGFLLNSWLGIAVGLVMYASSRRYAPLEERALAETFGTTWDEYTAHVRIGWL